MPVVLKPVEPAGSVIAEVVEVVAETRSRLGQPDSENDMNFQGTPDTLGLHASR